jgi:GTP-binding protein
MSFTVAIIGRPNVGKSTLFNRLVGRRLALVDDTPGLTRDRREGKARIGELEFTVIDTAGLEDADGDTLEAGMQSQTVRALDEADVALFLIDSRAGVTPLDEHFADWLRPRGGQVILVANKCEGRAGEAGYIDAYGLGLGDPVPLSAEHGEGLWDLHEALAPFDETAAQGSEVSFEDADEEDADDDKRPMQMAIVGRPNVGKSTLVNKLIGAERLLTGPEPGITRDAIAVRLEIDGRELELVDTAGLRRKARVTDRLERLSASDTLNTIRLAEVVAVVVDGTVGLEKQDLGIASMTVEEGRALLIVVNKWDLVDNGRETMTRLRERLVDSLPQAKGVQIVPLSALTGTHVRDLVPAVISVHEIWNKRVMTGPLNRWLSDVVERHPPPSVKRHRPRFRYATQAKARPPTFILFVSRPESVGETYLRYLENELRSAFDLPGTPIRVRLRKGHNPYAEKGRRQSAGRRPKARISRR